jgi:hypothetical protein
MLDERSLACLNKAAARQDALSEISPARPVKAFLAQIRIELRLTPAAMQGRFVFIGLVARQCHVTVDKTGVLHGLDLRQLFQRRQSEHRQELWRRT